MIKKIKNIFPSIIENNSESIVITDKNGKIIYANKAFLKLYKYTIKEIIEKNISILYPSKQSDYIISFLEQINITNEFNSEDHHIRSDGSSFPVLIYGSTIVDKSYRNFGIGFIIHDFSEYSNSQIIKTKLIQSKNILKIEEWYELSRMIAHDIKTPLSMISMAIDTILPSSDYSEIRETLIDIKEETKKIYERVQFLLKFPGFVEKGLSKINPVDILNKIIGFYIKSYNKIKIKKNFPKEVFFIYAIEELLNIAFQNIILNSIEAMSYNGIITISVDSKDNNILISIEDTGGGMSENVLNNLYNGYSSKKKGFGKGLLDTKDIVNHLNGKFTIINKKNIGLISKFIFPDF